jgi:hypothetical protein
MVGGICICKRVDSPQRLVFSLFPLPFFFTICTFIVLFIPICSAIVPVVVIYESRTIHQSCTNTFHQARLTTLFVLMTTIMQLFQFKLERLDPLHLIPSSLACFPSRNSRRFSTRLLVHPSCMTVSSRSGLGSGLFLLGYRLTRLNTPDHQVVQLRYGSRWQCVDV